MSGLVSPEPLLSGMSLKIFSAESAETFDLANLPITTISSTISSAFSSPFPFPTVLRLTFVVGGGKLCRGKYDDGTYKAVVTALADCGYEEDGRGGNELAGGAWKSHHDTSKNLKTVVVFTRPKGGDKDATLAADVAGITLEDGSARSPVFDTADPLHLLSVSSLKVFELMLSSKCPSWSEKKVVLQKLEDVSSLVQSFSDTLMKGQVLDDASQTLFDKVESLPEKVLFLKSSLSLHVDNLTLLPFERTLLTKQVSDKVDSLVLEVASLHDKPKRLLVAQSSLEKASVRLASLRGPGGGLLVPLKSESLQ